jgi:hypothetical protein
MIKCGAIAAVVIAASATGTATLVSQGSDSERIAGNDRTALEQDLTVRGTRALPTPINAETSIGDQPRRGDRPDYEPAALAMASLPDEAVRRGSR